MIKKFLAVFIALLFICSAFSVVACNKDSGDTGGNNTGGTGNEGGNNENTETIAEVDEVGEMIKLSAVDGTYSVISDGSGMSGNGGRIHTHDDDAQNMYTATGQTASFTFNIGRKEQLGKLYFWNYNAANALDAGAKEIKLSYSEDGSAYKELGNVTIEKADGSAKLAAAETFADFAGVTAQYIKVDVLSNYGASKTGLSEIRLFRYRPRVEVGAYVAATPIDRLNNSGNWTATAEDYNLTNGSGMSDVASFTATHDNDPANMATDSASSLGFKFDLQGNYPINSMTIWNYNDPDNLNYGLKSVKVQYSDDGGNWKSVRGSYTLPKGTGEELSPSLKIEFEDPIRARYFMLENLSNYGGDKIGLSEVRFQIGEGWYADDANDWSALFSNYNGWSGADGIYSVNLDGVDYDPTRDDSEKETFFVFSDSIISTVNPVNDRRSGVYMPNNTHAVLKGGKADPRDITFYYPENTSQAAMIKPDPAEPATSGGKNKYYWLGDTFIANGNLYVYTLRIDTVPPTGGFSFSQCGVDLACYDIVDGEIDFESLRLINDDDNILCDLNAAGGKYYFGGAVFENTEAAGVINPDGYYYIYGYQDTKTSGRKLVASRVKPENIEDFSSYEFLASNGSWTKSSDDLKFLASDISCEMSVTQIRTGENKGKYLFVNTHFTTGTDLKVSISDSPYGEFTGKTTFFNHDTVYTVPGSGNNSYNAKAHPALSRTGELIITYNVNGNDCFTYGDIYRPRFLRLAEVPAAK